MSQPLVLGLGNTLFSDDGFGVRVIEDIKNQGLAAEVVNGATLGLSLLEVLRRTGKTIVVDAVDMGQAPGTVARFTGEELLALPQSRNFSLHELGLLEVFKIGQSLNEDFSKVIVFGVQPQEMGPGEKLSQTVESKIPAVVEMIKKEVAL